MHSGNSHPTDQEHQAQLWEIGHTPICINSVLNLLSNYPDTFSLTFTIWFFKRLNYIGSRNYTTSNNLLSAVQLKEETLGKLRSESELGGILGPFSSISISTLNLTNLRGGGVAINFPSVTQRAIVLIPTLTLNYAQFTTPH